MPCSTFIMLGKHRARVQNTESPEIKPLSVKLLFPTIFFFKLNFRSQGREAHAYLQVRWHCHGLEGVGMTLWGSGLLPRGKSTDPGFFHCSFSLGFRPSFFAAHLPHVHDQEEASRSAGLAQSVRTNASNSPDFAWKALDGCFGMTQVGRWNDLRFLRRLGHPLPGPQPAWK